MNYKDIPENGILCRHANGDITVVDKSWPVTVLNGWKPLTAQEWWSFAPWNYDMDSANEGFKSILIKDNYDFVYKGYRSSFCPQSTFKECDSCDIIQDPIAWIPLPDNK